MSYVIYKIVCDDLLDYVYVGSTVAFRQRKSQHKNNCINPIRKNHNLKLYQTIRDNGGWDKWRMVIINECEKGLTKTQAHIIEEEFRVKLNGNMNIRKCYRTEEELKEYRKEYRKEWAINNKEKSKITCECGCKICKWNLTPHQKTKKHIKLMNTLGENEL